MPNRDYDCSVVGYGPVGALAALLLAERGLRVSIHERSTRPLDLPRAVGLDGESCRSFQSIGRGGDIDAILQPPRENDGLWFTNSKREKLFGQPAPAGAGHHGWRDIAFFDQPELEARMREFVAEQDRIDVFLGEEATGIESSEEGIRLQLRDLENDRTRELGCAYLLGCDGASSFVRRHCEIGWESLGYDQEWLVVDIELEPTAKLPPQIMQICDPNRLSTYICGKDPYRRWEFQLIEGETREEMENPVRIRQLLDEWLPSDQYEMRRAVVYQFHAATAERWRKGRVLLAGDSAHQTPPFLGQGLNSGFRDAVNLGWRIPLVLGGVCDDRLLDGYFDERDPHARTLVDAAVGIGKLMETLAAREAGRPDPHAIPSQSKDYTKERVAPPVLSGALMSEQIERGFPIGDPLRQPHVRSLETGESNDARGLDEFLGLEFALVGRTASDLELGRDATEIADRLGITRVALEGLAVTEGELDHVFDKTPAVLVRPDRNIFGVVEGDTSIDDVVLALAEQIALRPN